MTNDASTCAPWMQTYSGKAFDFIFTDARSIDINDIGHALSNICRFGGHTRSYYSVAQHSVLVSELVPRELKLPALLHDAAEAYMGDMISPLASIVEHPYLFYKTKVERFIEIAFGLAANSTDHPDIKFADLKMLATEKRDLMTREPRPWIDLPLPDSRVIVPECPSTARQNFFERYEQYSLEA